MLQPEQARETAEQLLAHLELFVGREVASMSIEDRMNFGHKLTEIAGRADSAAREDIFLMMGPLTSHRFEWVMGPLTVNYVTGSPGSWKLDPLRVSSLYTYPTHPDLYSLQLNEKKAAETFPQKEHPNLYNIKGGSRAHIRVTQNGSGNPDFMPLEDTEERPHNHSWIDTNGLTLCSECGEPSKNQPHRG